MRLRKYVQWFGLVSFALVAASASAATSPTSFPTSFDDGLYDKIFPYYTSECSVSQLIPKGEESGVRWGHALLYVKGACRDTSVPYPKLKICDDSVDLASPQAGVIVSLDNFPLNTLFLVIDGRDGMFSGGLRSDEPLNSQSFGRAADTVAKSGAMTGVKVNPDYMQKPADLSDEEYVARKAADTDYALSFGRESSCLRIPMNRAQINAEIDFLNQENEPYVTGKKDYIWSVFNNCATLTHNTLAAAGIRHEIEISQTDKEKLLNILSLNVEIPANEVLGSAKAVNKFSKIDTAKKVFKNSVLRADFNMFGTLPQIGGTLEQIPMHLYQNQIYEQGSARFLDIPVIHIEEDDYERVLENPQYATVQGNLGMLLARLQEIERKSSAEEDSSSKDSQEFVDFARRYNAWISKMIDDTIWRLTVLSKAH